MFSRTVSAMNGFGIWKVLLTPRCTSLCEAMPPIGFPSSRTLPPSGAYSPEITLIDVVLPEPLGPTSPRISPAAAWKLRPSRAWKPPKRFTRSATSRMGAGLGDTPPPSGRERDQSRRQEQHEYHDEQ